MSQKFQELINSEKPVLIDFFATWCGPCKVQSSVLNTVKENVGDLARIVKIDVDQFPAIAAEYGVRGVPTLAVFQNGNLLWKESGVHDVNTLTNLLQNFANQTNEIISKESRSFRNRNFSRNFRSFSALNSADTILFSVVETKVPSGA